MTRRARDRRLSAEEQAHLLAVLAEEAPRKADGTFGGGGSRNPWIAPVVRLALATAMRRGELLALAWEHIDLKRQVAHLPETKNGESRDVPLSKEAVRILKGLPGGAKEAGKVLTP